MHVCQQDVISYHGYTPASEMLYLIRDTHLPARCCILPGYTFASEMSYLTRDTRLSARCRILPWIHVCQGDVVSYQGNTFASEMSYLVRDTRFISLDKLLVYNVHVAL